jgi:hypothetical protein
MPAPIGWRAWVAKSGFYAGLPHIERRGFGTRYWVEQCRACCPWYQDFACTVKSVYILPSTNHETQDQ